MRFTYAGCGYIGGKPTEDQLAWADGDMNKLVFACAWKMLRERGVPTQRDDETEFTIGEDWRVTCRHTTDPTLLLTDKRPLDVKTDFILWGHATAGMVLIMGVISRDRMRTDERAKQLVTTTEWLRAFVKEAA